MTAIAEQLGEGPELDLLYVIGLFDRPADAGCIAALRMPPSILDLTGNLSSLDEVGWRDLLERLRNLGLLAEASHLVHDELDAHPLVREHFGARLRDNREDAWKAGHDRLYEYLQTVPDQHQPDTLAVMVPLFQAVHHGCQAGRHQEALDRVYRARIRRENGLNLFHKLGVFSADLGLVASFFDPPFEHPAAGLTKASRATLLNFAASNLRALGRLGEAVALMREGLKHQLQWENWKSAAIVTSNLSELQLALGNVAAALAAGEAAVEHADRSGYAFHRMSKCTTLADGRHQAGELAAAQALFEEAEAMQAERQPAYPRLYSFQGYRYCDLLLSLDQAEAVRERAIEAQRIARWDKWLLNVALDHLSLGRAELVLGDWNDASHRFDEAVDGLREAGRIDHLPRGLLARAAFFRETKAYKKSRKDLAEVIRIATRCGMRLYECDAHLEY
ncbi:MAG: hypothetical protein ACR2QF_12245, partial [Geminicoccaceae bacterium]